MLERVDFFREFKITSELKIRFMYYKNLTTNWDLYNFYKIFMHNMPLLHN